MSPIPSTVLSRARVTLRCALERGEPATDVYPIAAGMSRVYASADPHKINGRDRLIESGTTFHLGSRR